MIGYLIAGASIAIVGMVIGWLIAVVAVGFGRDTK